MSYCVQHMSFVYYTLQCCNFIEKMNKLHGILGYILNTNNGLLPTRKVSSKLYDQMWKGDRA